MSLLMTGNSAVGSDSTPASPKTVYVPGAVRMFLACFRSVPLAIVLLSLLALTTLTGVLLPQEGTVEIARIKAQFGPQYRMFKAMGLFNVYSSPWFLTLEALFFCSLLFGSFQWLKPACLAAVRKTFHDSSVIEASPMHFTMTLSQPAEALSKQVAALLKRRRYRVHAPTDAHQEFRLYACKGNITRLGPAIAHLGILMMLVSSVYGAFFGFKAQKLAVPGETFTLRDSQFFMPNVNERVWLGSVPEWKVRVNHFRIDYYPPGQAPSRDAVARQYYADLSILTPNGRETRREVISVNHPLTVDDVTLYQASFNPTGKLFLEVNGKPMTVSINTNFMNRPISLTELPDGRALVVFPFFAQQDPGVSRNYMVAFIRDRHGFAGARPGKMPPNLRLLEGAAGKISGLSIRYVRPEIATGLQIKKGPEVPWMYLSYLIIISGAILCIFSQRRLWIAIRPDEHGSRLAVMYQTNKARLSFMKELQAIHSALATDSVHSPTRSITMAASS